MSLSGNSPEVQARGGGDLGGLGSIPATAQFPVDLQRMLNTVEQLGMDDIVGWQNNGASFVVHKKDEFENQVMPRSVSVPSLCCH